jgi:hypothetical protein
MIVRMGRPNDVPACKRSRRRRAPSIPRSQASSSRQQARRLRPTVLSREPRLSQRYPSHLSASLLFSRWTGHCIWPVSPFFQTPQIVVLELGSWNG